MLGKGLHAYRARKRCVEINNTTFLELCISDVIKLLSSAIDYENRITHLYTSNYAKHEFTTINLVRESFISERGSVGMETFDKS